MVSRRTKNEIEWSMANREPLDSTFHLRHRFQFRIMVQINRRHRAHFSLAYKIWMLHEIVLHYFDFSVGRKVCRARTSSTRTHPFTLSCETTAHAKQKNKRTYNIVIVWLFSPQRETFPNAKTISPEFWKEAARHKNKTKKKRSIKAKKKRRRMKKKL